jgi:hypothetical protein
MSKKYWTEEKIISELEKLTVKYGKFPACTQMPGAMWTAIKKTKKGIAYYQKLLNAAPREKPKGFWKSEENLEKEVLELVAANNGLFPTLAMVESKCGNGGKKAVLAQGGIYKLAKKMGFFYFVPNAKGGILTSDGHYVLSSYEFLLDEFLYSRGIEHEVNGIIHCDYKYKFDFKIDNVYFEIWGFEKNRKHPRCVKYAKKRKIKENLYKKLGLQLIGIECDVFRQPVEAIFQHFESICKTFKWNTTQLREPDLKGYFEKCTLWTESKIKYEFEEIIKKTGTFPKSKELKMLNKGGLLDAATRKGGLTKFAIMLGFEKKPKVKKWSEELLLETLLKNFKEFPTNNQLLKSPHKNLSQQIVRFGGFAHFREQFYKQQSS